MKVMIDATWWHQGPPSGKAIVRNIVHGWHESFPNDQIILICKQLGYLDRVECLCGNINFPILNLKYQFLPNGIAILLMQKVKEVDLIITQNFVPLFQKAYKIVLFHDVIFMRNPKWFKLSELFYLKLALKSTKKADLIWTSSKNETKNLICEVSGCEDKVMQFNLAISIELVEAVEKKPDQLTLNTQYILTVGRLNERKNIKRLIEAFINRQYLHSNYHLVIVGNENGKFSKIKIESKYKDKIIWLSNITDHELKWLYKRAKCFVFPSLDEGFGLPLLEAEYFEVPICASDLPVFHEVSKVFVPFNPYDYESISDAIEDTLKITRDSIGKKSIDSWSNNRPNWIDILIKLRLQIEKKVTKND